MAKASKPQVKRPRRSLAQRQAERENVLWSALAAYAGKQAVRDQLEDGSQHSLAVAIAGEVAGGWVDLELTGSLLVNHPQTVAASTAPNYARLTALLLQEIPASRRAAVTAQIAEALALAGELPAPADADLEPLAEAFLSRLRQKTSQTKRGAVRFEPRPVD